MENKILISLNHYCCKSFLENNFHTLGLLVFTSLVKETDSHI